MSSRSDVEPLVDLGEDFDVPAADPTAGRWWAQARQIQSRRFRSAVLVVAVLVLVAASASAIAPPLRLTAHIPIGLDASAMIKGTTLYVYDITGGSDGIRAYGLINGKLRWSAATEELAPETDMQYIDGSVVVSMADTDADGEHTVAFDARTGQRLWSSDFGYAVDAAAGVVVESAPRPPGYNYVGTVSTATFRLVDPRTGQIRWTVAVPDDCLTQLGNADAGRPTVLVELCSNSSRLTVVNLADGRTSVSRQVSLGHPEDNIFLPPPDQMAEPQLVVAGETLLIAHANAPQPTMDAYAITDLNELWSGLPVIDGQDIDECGTALCVYDGASNGSVFDLRTGKQIGLIAPRTVPAAAVGSLALVPLGQAITLSDGSLVPSVSAGVSVQIPIADDPDPRVRASALWLAAWHVVASKTTGKQSARATPIEILHGVDQQSCVEFAGYLACATSISQLSLWKVPPV